MNYYVATAFSFSIFIPSVIAAFLFNKIDKRYYPFLFCLWIGSINEVVSFLLISNRIQNLLNNNIYVFIESLLLLAYLSKAGLFKRKYFFKVILLFLVLFWFLENFIFQSIFLNSTYFRIFSSFTIVCLSIELLNQQLLEYHPKILKNADFILCCCFINYLTYKALIQAFIIYGAKNDTVFFIKIYIILIYINFIVNLLYIIAVVCMPGKARFITQSS
jgi:hypothetical protein